MTSTSTLPTTTVAPTTATATSTTTGTAKPTMSSTATKIQYDDSGESGEELIKGTASLSVTTSAVSTTTASTTQTTVSSTTTTAEVSSTATTTNTLYDSLGESEEELINSMMPPSTTISTFNVPTTATTTTQSTTAVATSATTTLSDWKFGKLTQYQVDGIFAILTNAGLTSGRKGEAMEKFVSNSGICYEEHGESLDSLHGPWHSNLQSMLVIIVGRTHCDDSCSEL